MSQTAALPMGHGIPGVAARRWVLSLAILPSGLVMLMSVVTNDSIRRVAPVVFTCAEAMERWVGSTAHLSMLRQRRPRQMAGTSHEVGPRRVQPGGRRGHTLHDHTPIARFQATAQVIAIRCANAFRCTPRALFDPPLRFINGRLGVTVP